tara:strand:+ start:6425 stop:6685 length:261 start_codon:yes stop_codon:yes gene_type:complete
MKEDDFSLDEIPKFQIPSSFLEQLYEFTGNSEGSAGYVLSYVDNSGRALVCSRSSSQIVEMGLRKALEKYLIELEEGEISFDIPEE